MKNTNINNYLCDDEKRLVVTDTASRVLPAECGLFQSAICAGGDGSGEVQDERQHPV